VGMGRRGGWLGEGEKRAWRRRIGRKHGP